MPSMRMHRTRYSALVTLNVRQQELMNHSIHRIRAFKVVGEYMLHIEFEDGLERTVDLEGVLEGEVFGPLKDPRLFAQVELDPETPYALT